jgi:hypothetical protein
MAKKKNEVAVQSNNALVAQTGRPLGFEAEESREDLIIPRAKLLQALSPECVEGTHRPGVIINSLTKDPLSSEFQPVFWFKNWIRWNPRRDGDPNYEPGAMIWRTDDPNDPRVLSEARFGDNGEKPLATAYLNFFCIFKDSAMPVVISFSNTSYKAGKNLFSLAKFAGVDMFARKYSLTTKSEKNDAGTYFVFVTNNAGIASPDEYARGKQLWESFASRKKDIQVHDEADVKADGIVVEGVDGDVTPF